MQQDHAIRCRNTLNGNRKVTGSMFWDGLFNERAIRAIKRCSAGRLTFEVAELSAAAGLLADAREALALASELDIARMVEKNPSIIRLARNDLAQPKALLAYLPLNEFGALMLVSGVADPSKPDPAWITRPGEVPSAIYLWLFYGPGENIRCLESIGEVFDSVASGKTTIFSRGATDLSEQLQLKFGALKAHTLYPKAPASLLVLVPPGSTPHLKKRDHHIKVRPIRTLEGLAEVISIRSATYVAEQFASYAEEFDGNDLCATHLIAHIDDDPAGAVRIRYFGDFAKLERLAVKREFRRSRVAFALCRAAFNHVRRKGFRRVYGHASDQVAPLWRHMGAQIIPDRRPFRFAGIEYREMMIELDNDPLAIRLGADPMVTNRPEGFWDEPSSLDWSNVRTHPERLRLMTAGSDR